MEFEHSCKECVYWEFGSWTKECAPCIKDPKRSNFIQMEW